MDNRWYKEDRDLPKEDREEAQAESKKALANSTLFQRRLERILKDMLDATDRSEEDFNDVNWSLKAAGNVARRKTLKEIIKLIDIK